jgi:hypothetical protein
VGMGAIGCEKGFQFIRRDGNFVARACFYPPQSGGREGRGGFSRDLLIPIFTGEVSRCGWLR